LAKRADVSFGLGFKRDFKFVDPPDVLRMGWSMEDLYRDVCGLRASFLI